MTRKSAEERVQPMLKAHGIYAWKIKDWTPDEGKEPGTDYSITPLIVHLEVKQTNGDGYYQLSYVTPTERRILNRYGGWMLFEFGMLPAPKGKDAYLISWDEYRQIETTLQEQGIQSITRQTSPRGHPGADTLFPKESRLVWKNGTWYIPKKHEFMRWMSDRLIETTTRFLDEVNSDDETDTPPLDPIL